MEPGVPTDSSTFGPLTCGGAGREPVDGDSRQNLDGLPFRCPRQGPVGSPVWPLQASPGARDEGLGAVPHEHPVGLHRRPYRFWLPIVEPLAAGERADRARQGVASLGSNRRVGRDTPMVPKLPVPDHLRAVITSA